MIYAMGNQVERMSKREYPTNHKANYLFNKIYDSYIHKYPFYYNGSLSKKSALPNILSLAFEGIDAESLITLLDMKGVVVSAGSACCAGDKEPSRVLKAIGLTDEQALGTIRISLDKDITQEECDKFVRILGECLESLKMVGGE
jgi:cysteine desulfurase